MIPTTIIRRCAALLLGVTAIGLVPTAPTASALPESQDLGAGGEYFPLTPSRIYDEEGIDSDSSVTIPVVGVAGVPAENVLAVAVNVTIANVPGRGFASVTPSDYEVGSSDPTSLINFQYAGHTVPNFGIVGVGSAGEITVDLTTPKVDGTARVVVDIFGFVATSSLADGEEIKVEDGARMVTVTPERLVDTRDADGLTTGDPVSAGDSIDVQVRGVGSVPDRENVSAVVVNMTGINNCQTGERNCQGPSKQTYLAATPTQQQGGSETSNGNYPAGVVKANLAIVPLSEDGRIFVYNNKGEIHVALDVVAYLEQVDDEETAGRIVPLAAPFRSFDTRETEFGNAKLGYSTWEDWSFEAFADSVSLDDVAIGAQSGLFGNLTAVGLERIYPTQEVRSFITMNPAIDGPFPDEPGNSNLNFDESGPVSNSAVVTYGSKSDDAYMVSAFNSNGRTHYALDVYAVILD